MSATDTRAVVQACRRFIVAHGAAGTQHPLVKRIDALLAALPEQPAAPQGDSVAGSGLPRPVTAQEDQWLRNAVKRSAKVVHSGVGVGLPLDTVRTGGEAESAALEALVSMCEQHGDFRNGVTDSTGSIDEGEVRAGEIIRAARSALVQLGAAAILGEEVARAIHYPECWDTAAYPTLESAMAELAHSFRCANQDRHSAAGEQPMPRTADLVDRFAASLKEKLAAAEKKYGYSDHWAKPDWLDECRAKLLEHVAKGDPRDVAAYCAFLWHHGESTAATPARTGEEVTDSERLVWLELHFTRINGVHVAADGSVRPFVIDCGEDTFLVNKGRIRGFIDAQLGAVSVPAETASGATGSMNKNPAGITGGSSNE